MRDQAGFFDVDERLRQLSAKGDSLERLNAVVDFALFRADLEQAVPRSDRAKGGRPPFDHVLTVVDFALFRPIWSRRCRVRIEQKAAGRHSITC